VFILGDNVGYGVLSSYNGGILDTPTPRIDRLADEGLRLTNFNVENQCTPSRAELMTGRLPIRSGIGKAIAAGAPGGLHPWEITIAEMLSDVGYRTAIFGKWHLGVGKGRLPTDQGFDEWFGFETTDIIYWTGNPGMPPHKDVDYIREVKRGETPRNVRLYDEDTRRQIDRMHAQISGAEYDEWRNDNGYVAFEGIRRTAAFLQTFAEYPPSQTPASFSVDQIVEGINKKIEQMQQQQEH
jgi:arylsulfatase A-like enzyme